MAAQTQAREAKRKDGFIKAYPVKQNESIYKGSLVCVNTTNGYAIKGADTANYKLLGVAVEDSTGTDSTDGIREVRVYRTGTFEFGTTQDLGQTSVGQKVYIEFDNEVNKTGGTGSTIFAGTVTEYISATKVRVDITYAAMFSGSDA